MSQQFTWPEAVSCLPSRKLSAVTWPEAVSCLPDRKAVSILPARKLTNVYTWPEAVICLPDRKLSAVYLDSSCQLFTWTVAVGCLSGLRLSAVYLISSCRLFTWPEAVSCSPGRKLSAVYMAESWQLFTWPEAVSLFPFFSQYIYGFGIPKMNIIKKLNILLQMFITWQNWMDARSDVEWMETFALSYTCFEKTPDRIDLYCRHCSVWTCRRLYKFNLHDNMYKTDGWFHQL